MSVSLSLVIPCYNEASNLPLLFDRCMQVFTRGVVEVVFVDNGSSDRSPEVFAELVPKHPFARMVRVEVNQGYGHGILAGLAAAKNDILGWTHADMQTDPEDALTGLAMFAQAPGPARLFVKGRRYGRPLADVFFTAGMGVFETVLLGKPMWDINAQPTLFHRSFFDGWNNPPHDFSLDLFAYYTARTGGLSIRRFPVRFGDRAHGTSHWNVNWRAKLKFIRRTLDFSFELRRRLRHSG
jgi:glycosyltransferase involved in cell wall biosynthesis